MKSRAAIPLFLLLLFGLWFPLAAQVADTEANREASTAPPDAPVLPDSLGWRVTLNNSLNITQAQFSNWQGGGQNSVAVTALANYLLDYIGSPLTWENQIGLAYGMIRTDEAGLLKNQDRIDLLSQMGYRINDRLRWSARGNLRTQFAPGFNLPNDSLVVSRAFAPAFLQVGLGIDYRPADWLSLIVAPVTGRFVFVLDPTLSDAGAFGVRPAAFDENGLKTRDGQRILPEFGASATVRINRKLKNGNLVFSANFFNNYTDPDPANRRNIDVNAEFMFLYNINKWLSFNLQVQALYDHNIPIIVETSEDGSALRTGPRLQYKHALALGLAYNFVNKRAKTYKK
jgi:hypothetical protein